MAAYNINTCDCKLNMPMEKHPKMQQNDKNVAQNMTSSKQLLYSEKFDGCLEQKLQVAGKGTHSSHLSTYRPQPSAVLSRVRDFLPKLAFANEQLQNLPPEEVDIENVDGHKGPLIEMSLALIPGMESDVESDTERDSESDSSDEQSTDTDVTGNADVEKKPCKRQKVYIEELACDDAGKQPVKS